MGDLSKHFSAAEFACKDNCGYGQPHPRLVSVLEAIRDQAGDKPIVPTSGLRCPPHNAEVHGAPRSRHCSGEAADIPAGLVREQGARRAGATGIGIKDGWVIHVDVRQTRSPVVWEYG